MKKFKYLRVNIISREATFSQERVLTVSNAPATISKEIVHWRNFSFYVLEHVIELKIKFENSFQEIEFIRVSVYREQKLTIFLSWTKRREPIGLRDEANFLSVLVTLRKALGSSLPSSSTLKVYLTSSLFRRCRRPLCERLNLF